MFTVEQRQHVRERLVEFARYDEAIAGMALTGSQGDGRSDRWSDTDVVLAVRGSFTDAVRRWTRWLYAELDAVHHVEHPAGSRLICVVLLPDWLELDLNFVSEDEFGAQGPQWQTVFGTERGLEAFPRPDAHGLIGLAWNHALHARISIERGHGLQSEYWISALRNHLVTLACTRLDLPHEHAKGAHLLSVELTRQLGETLVRSTADSELRRALKAAVEVLAAEVRQVDGHLANRLGPMLAELTRTETWEG